MELVLTPDQIQQQYNLNHIVAEILYNRGIFTKRSLDEYLYADFNDLHSPFKIPGVIEVSDIIKESAYFGDKIVLYSDYDVDGIISAAILYKAILKKQKSKCVYICFEQIYRRIWTFNKSYRQNGRRRNRFADYPRLWY